MKIKKKLWFNFESNACDDCCHSVRDCMMCPLTKTIMRLEKWTVVAEQDYNFVKVQFT